MHTDNTENKKLNRAIKNRWSPKAFTDKPVTDEMLKLLFEAARWAPSSRNEQPWRYFYARREDKKAFAQLSECLTGGNQEWAPQARVLMVSVMKKNLDYKNRPNGKALHDTGAANVSIAIQAAEMGLQVHQMGGFDKEKATALLQLDTDNYEPVTFFAVGFPAHPEELTDELEKRKTQHLSRKEQKEFVFQLGK